MTDLDQSFSVGSDPRLEVKISNGSVRVLPGDSGTIEILIQASARNLERLTVQQHGDSVIVHQRQRRVGSVEVTARVPSGTTVQAHTASADLIADVPLKSLTGELGSGDVATVDIVDEATVTTASGDVRLGNVGGDVHIATASGDVRVGELAGDAHCKTVSGDIVIGRAVGHLAARTVSGDLKVEAFAGNELSLETKSGDARIGLEPGFLVNLDIATLSGDVRNDFEFSTEPAGTAKQATLSVKTLSGDVTLFSA